MRSDLFVNKRILFVCRETYSKPLWFLARELKDTITVGAFYIMSSDSTEAGIHTGDLVIAKSIDVKDFKENDNIIYERNGEMIVKKIIRVEKNSKKANIYIENDNLIINEKQKDARVEGKIVHVIRGFGNVALFIQSPIGTLDVLAIAVCIFIIIKKIGRETSQNDGASEKETV